MRTIMATPKQIISLGRHKEHLAAQIIFNVKDWIDWFGNDGQFILAVKNNASDTYYQPEIERDGDFIIWKVTNYDTETVGLGRCELTYIKDNVVIKSCIYIFEVSENIIS